MFRAVSPGPITDIHSEYGHIGPYVVTKRGTLLAALELSGRDPDGLARLDLEALSVFSQVIYQNLAPTITITQYYAHIDNAVVRLRPRDHPVASLLSQRREAFLNKRHLTTSRIIHYFEMAPDDDLTQLRPVEILKNLVFSPFSPANRTALLRSIGERHAIHAGLSELQRQIVELDSALREVTDRWSSILSARPLAAQEQWAFMRFLATLDADVLDSALLEPVPVDHWDQLLDEGDRIPVTVDSMDTFKFVGVVNRYARMMTVSRFGGKLTTPGIWALNKNSPVYLPHNFVLMTRFKPLSALQKSLFFKSRSDELERQSFSLKSIIRGEENMSEKDKRAIMRESIRTKLKELEEAEIIQDRWGRGSSFALCFDESPASLRRTCIELRKSMTQCGFKVLWESAGLPEAYKAFLPGGSGYQIRDVPLTTSQYAAVSLIYKSSDGQRVVHDMGDEEAQYVFLSADGTPFHYSPFVGGKILIFIIGPIRSGKSFLRAALATHFGKYGGLYRALDIDPGAEPVAECYGNDGAIFRIDGAHTRGFNLYASFRGPDDHQFHAHLRQQILSMIATNDSPQLREINIHEQAQLDRAIAATSAMTNERLRGLGTVSSHCEKSLKMKLARFVKGGIYGHWFDQTHDAIGAIDKRVVAFNIAGAKEDATALPIAMNEIFYRVTSTFENPAYRGVPKLFDADEAHFMLKYRFVCDALSKNIRTWGKHYAGVSLSTQSAVELAALPDWPMLRSAATTLFFTADPELNIDLYRDTFGLTYGACETIRNLIPKREVYIVQPELGVSKKLIVDVEPEQYVICTSHPKETTIRQRNRALSSTFEEAVDRTVRDLGLVEDEDAEPSTQEAHYA